MIAQQVEKGTPDGGGLFKVSPSSFAADTRRILQQFAKEAEPPKSAVQVPVAPAAQIFQAIPAMEPVAVPDCRVHEIPVQLMHPLGLPMAMPSPASYSGSGVTDFKWDPDSCAQNITLTDDNRACFLMEGGYCFRTVLSSTPFISGVHYWEIHADPRTENELKIGVAGKKNFNLNTAFCDYEFGWGYYGLGQLRHGNNSAGPKYGKTFKNNGYLGLCLDMNKGQICLALNGEYLGVAFKDEALRKGPIYAAVSLLHKAGCKLVVNKPTPSYFVH